MSSNYATEIPSGFRFVWWTLAFVAPAIVLAMSHWRRLAGTTDKGGTALWWLILILLNIVAALLAGVGMGFAFITYAVTTTNFVWAVVPALIEPLVFLVAAVTVLRPDTDVTWAYWPGLLTSLALSVTALVFLFLLKTSDALLVNYLPPLLYGGLPLVRLMTLVTATLESGSVVAVNYGKVKPEEEEELGDM